MKTFTFPSRSDPMMSHQVTLLDNGALKCTCRGFKTPSRCWHVKKVAEDEGLNLAIGGELIGNSITGYQTITTPKPKTPSLFEVITIPVKPMLARGLKDKEDISDFSPSEFVMEQKFDGHRMIVQRKGDDVTAWSRAGNIRVFPNHLVKLIRNSMPEGIYDSELVVPGGCSTDVVRLDLSDKLELYLFDMLSVVGHQALDRPLAERRSLLEVAVVKLPKDGPIHISQQFKPSFEEVKRIWDMGGEGAILKRIMANYQERRSNDWVKVKMEKTKEVPIVGFEMGLLGPHSKVCGVDEKGNEVSVKTLNDWWRAEFAKNSEKYIGRMLRFHYQEQTRDGRYRHPMMDHIV